MEETTREDALSITHDDLKSFADDVQSLWCPYSVPVLESPPSSLIFLREFVSKSRPCLISNALPVGECAEGTNESNDIEHFDGGIRTLHLSLDDVIDRMDHIQIHDGVGDPSLITVDVTPDGHGDCIRKVTGEIPDFNHNEDRVRAISPKDSDGSGHPMFIRPLEARMSLHEFRDKLRKSESYADEEVHEYSGIDLEYTPTVHPNEPNPCPSTELPNGAVYYYSQQNDCLRNELAPIADVVPPTLPWAAEAFGTDVDAINMWIGNSRVVSSMHKDPYENLLYVCSGEKVVLLCPPCDVACLYQTSRPSGGFVYENGSNDCTHADREWRVQPEFGGETVKWIEPDVQNLLSPQNRDEMLRRYPLLQHVHPIEVRVLAGTMLYIPSLWFHRVTQTCETVAVNWWYDMVFDGPSWCYFLLLQQLSVKSSTRNNIHTRRRDATNQMSVPELP